MAANTLEEKINKIRQQNEEIKRRYEVKIERFDINNCSILEIIDSIM